MLFIVGMSKFNAPSQALYYDGLPLAINYSSTLDLAEQSHILNTSTNHEALIQLVKQLLHWHKTTATLIASTVLLPLACIRSLENQTHLKITSQVVHDLDFQTYTCIHRLYMYIHH